MKSWRNKAIFTLIATLQFAHAENPRHLVVQSKLDKYELDLQQNHGEISGKPIDMSVLQTFLPLLTDNLGDECPSMNTAPDVTVREDGKARQIYIRAGVVKDHGKCLTVEGEGMLYFPVHRDFLIGPKLDAIVLKSSLQLLKRDAKLMDLSKSAHGWKSQNKDQMLNWDFFDRFENSLSSFSIRFRIGMEAGADKPHVTLKSGGQVYEFYKLTGVLWAVKMPKNKWLEASDSWSFWYDLDAAVLEDRFAPQIRAFGGPGQSPAERLAAVEKLESFWSPNLRDLYHRLLLNHGEAAAVQRVALRRLKSKPSTETAGVMVQFLQQSRDDDLKRSAAQILKISYPKGPLYNPNASLAERDKAVHFWSDWWAKNHKQP